VRVFLSQYNYAPPGPRRCTAGAASPFWHDDHAWGGRGGGGWCHLRAVVLPAGGGYAGSRHDRAGAVSTVIPGDILAVVSLTPPSSLLPAFRHTPD